MFVKYIAANGHWPAFLIRIMENKTEWSLSGMWTIIVYYVGFFFSFSIKNLKWEVQIHVAFSQPWISRPTECSGVFQSQNIFLVSFHFYSVYFQDFCFAVWRSASIQLKDIACLSEVTRYCLWLSGYQRDSYLWVFLGFIQVPGFLNHCKQLCETVNESNNYPLLCLTGVYGKPIPTLKCHSALMWVILLCARQ